MADDPDLKAFGSFLFPRVGGPTTVMSEYARVTGDFGTRGGPVNGSPSSFVLTSDANWKLSGPPSVGPYFYVSRDAEMVTEPASNEQWMIWVVGPRASGLQLWGIGFIEDGAGNTTLVTWRVDTVPPNTPAVPAFTNKAGGTNAIVAGDIFRIAVECDDDAAANYPMSVHLNINGTWYYDECNNLAGDANITGIGSHMEIWQHEVTAKGGGIAIGHAAYFWNDDDGSEDHTQLANVPDIPYRPLPFPVGANVTGVQDWSPSPGGEKEYYCLADIKRGTELKFDAAEHYDGVAYTDRTTEWGEEAASNTWADLTGAANDFQYLGHDGPFHGFEFLEGGGSATVGANFTPQYWTDDGGGAWTNLSGVTDNTDKGLQDGEVMWILPSNWDLKTVDGVSKYWARVDFTGTPTTASTMCKACYPLSMIEAPNTANLKAQFEVWPITAGVVPDGVKLVMQPGGNPPDKVVACVTGETSGAQDWLARSGGRFYNMPDGIGLVSPGSSDWTEALYNSLQVEVYNSASPGGVQQVRQIFALVCADNLVLAGPGAAESDVSDVCPAAVGQRKRVALQI